MRILAVDDNVDNLVAVTAMLRAFLPGSETETALSGAEGILKARSFRPDTILLDIQMPGMDGYEACRQLKADPATQHVPVIFLTAHDTDPASRVRGLEIGGDAFLAKPVEPAELMAQVRAMGRIKRAEDALREDVRGLESAIDDRTLALRTTEQNLRSMLDAITESAFLMDREGRVIAANETFAARVGRVPGECVGKLVFDLIPADAADRRRGWMDEVLRTGVPRVFEDFRQGRWYRHNLVPIPDVGGLVTRLAVFAIDFTERRLTEEALEKRVLALTSPLGDTGGLRFEDLFDVGEIQRIQDAFAEATGVASLITDPAGRPITEPSNFCALCKEIIRGTEKGLENCHRSDSALGRRNPDGPTIRPCLSGGLWDGGASICAGDHHVGNWLVGQVLDDSFDEEKMVAYAREIGADEAAFRRELGNVTRMPRAQFEKVCRALFLIAGALSRLATQNVQQARAISERRQKEESLRESETRFRAAFENANVAVALVALDGRLLKVNDGACRIFGYSRDELERMNVDELAFPEDRSVSLRSRQGEGGGGPERGDFTKRYLRRDGRIVWARLSSSLVRGARGEPLYIVAHVQDITDRVRAEEDLQALSRELERRVIERTAELQSANKELESFSYSVSHDLRAPLRAIDGFSGKIAATYGGSLDDEGKRLLDVVRRNALKMGRLIDDLLAFSRTSRTELRHTRVDMCELARVAFAEVTSERPAAVAISFTVGELPWAWGDPSLLRQVWLNLLSNAVKFSARAENPLVEVTGELEGDAAVYRVRDNGVGFDMAYASKLFGVFQRLHGVTEFEGTGVGLALVHRILARHGGRVRAEGVVGGGATFEFVLPERGKGPATARSGEVAAVSA